MNGQERCAWARDPLDAEYHDAEWGMPSHEPRHLFEFLILEGAQAGLSWHSILVRREGYRAAFCDFDPARVAELSDEELARILAEGAIIRNRLKVWGARHNAQAWLRLDRPVEFLWSFVARRPRQNAWRELSELPAETEESRAMSVALKRAGFTFVGPTICYAYMQAVGMVNDHLVSCPRYDVCRELGREFRAE